jgi:hypothetical protein
MNEIANEIFDIRKELEDQASIARGIESAAAGLSCNDERAKNGCQMLLLQHAAALQELVERLCQINAERIAAGGQQ